MASISIRIDDDLKARACRELEKLGVIPSELMQGCCGMWWSGGVAFRARPNDWR